MTDRYIRTLDAQLEAMDAQARRELTAAPWEWATADTTSFRLPNVVNSCKAAMTIYKNSHRKVTA